MSPKTLPALALVSIVCTWTGVSEAKTFNISEGQSIQAVIDKAEPGDTIQVLPGEYPETIVINKPGLTVHGMEFEGVRATLDGLNKDTTERAALAISIEANDVICKGFRIRNVSSPAVRASDLENIEISGLDIDVNGDFGLHLENIVGLKLIDTTVRGAQDAAIWINLCQDVALADNEAFHSAIGLTLLDSIQVRVDDFTAHNTGMGAVLANTDGNEGKAEYTAFTNSRFIDIGTAHAPESVASSPFYLPGLGIHIVGASHAEVARCYFENNASVGVLTRQWTGVADTRPLGPSHVYVHHNVYSGNGTSPSAAYTKAFPDFPGGDLYWDGQGRRNQWQEADPEEGALKVHPENLISKFGGVHTNVMHFQ